ncbi:tumor necrosis factor receptor superfamily member 1A-like, partial [Cetorhinus maximus]
ETAIGVQSEVSESENLKKPLAVGKTHLLIPIQEETPTESLSCPTALPGLPDCVQAAGRTLLPNNSHVNYVIADLVPASRWKEFVRRLGMNDHDIERSEMDNRHSYREAQYGMVRVWREKQGAVEPRWRPSARC